MSSITKDMIELEKAKVSLIEGNIIKIDVKENSLVGVEEIKAFQVAKRRLLGDAVHYVLFITPKMGTMTREAREFSASSDVNENAKAKAVVVSSLVMRIIANFFLGTNKPPVLHKIFNSEKDALAWLKKIRQAD
jgi:hypothetical protein